MNREQVGKTFVELIKPFVRIPEPKEINESSLLVSDLNVNSTRLVDIILEIEDKFKIRIADEEIGRF
jgi:acyl carrier protein